MVGSDDSPLAQRIQPTLTTVRQDIAAKGRAAVSALTAEIHTANPRTSGDTREPATDVLLATTLIVRASTGPPGAG